MQTCGTYVKNKKSKNHQVLYVKMFGDFSLKYQGRSLIAKKKKETLKAVNVVTMNPNVKYSIQIYKNPKKGKPTSGKKLLKRAMTGTIKEAGTHTIDLKQKVRLVKGEKFSIVIKIGSTALIGCDHSDNFGWIRFVNKTAKGQSYVCLKGNKWYDLYSARLTMRIKAYTTT